MIFTEKNFERYDRLKAAYIAFGRKHRIERVLIPVMLLFMLTERWGYVLPATAVMFLVEPIVRNRAIEIYETELDEIAASTVFIIVLLMTGMDMVIMGAIAGLGVSGGLLLCLSR